ncbi:MAG: hypothetical protein IJS83_06090 [Acholeplasmatales bacterium]|nr:hypothetical protein [Acholeplasmatales bacterium]
MSELECILANVDATMKMEGMPLTEEDKNRILDCLTGKSTFDNEIKKIIEKFSKK